MKKDWQAPVGISRADQAKKISSILQDHLQGGLVGMKCLEIGCADGSISHFLSADLGTVYGIEIDLDSLLTSPHLGEKKLLLTRADGRHLPFPAAHFDIIVLAQVYEHMTSQEKLSSEVFRVLKTGGVCFFSGPNRWQLVEPHYFLPFLSWLPHKCASRYLKLSGRGTTFDIYPRGYRGLKRLWGRFRIVDYTWQMLKNPAKFSAGDRKGIPNLARVPDWVLKALVVCYPNFNWILMKD